MQPKSSRLRHGFNLIETAIVLAVVGLVIGGIWVAATAVNDAYKQRVFFDGIGVMLREGRNKVTSSGFACGQEVYTSATRYAEDAAMLPTNWEKGGYGMIAGGITGWARDLNIFVNCDGNGRKYLDFVLYSPNTDKCQVILNTLSVMIPASERATAFTCVWNGLHWNAFLTQN